MYIAIAKLWAVLPTQSTAEPTKGLSGVQRPELSGNVIKSAHHTTPPPQPNHPRTRPSGPRAPSRPDPARPEPCAPSRRPWSNHQMASLPSGLARLRGLAIATRPTGAAEAVAWLHPHGFAASSRSRRTPWTSASARPLAGSRDAPLKSGYTLVIRFKHFSLH